MKSIQELEKDFFAKKLKYTRLFKDGDIDGALNLMKEIWESFEEPKMEQDLIYLLVEDFIKMCTEAKKFELANKYVSLLFVANLRRVDYGTRELVAGKLAYEQGELELAKQLFYISNNKSKGELLKGKENKKYKDLLK